MPSLQSTPRPSIRINCFPPIPSHQRSPAKFFTPTDTRSDQLSLRLPSYAPLLKNPSPPPPPILDIRTHSETCPRKLPPPYHHQHLTFQSSPQNCPNPAPTTLSLSCNRNPSPSLSPSLTLPPNIPNTLLLQKPPTLQPPSPASFNPTLPQHHVRNPPLTLSLPY